MWGIGSANHCAGSLGFASERSKRAVAPGWGRLTSGVRTWPLTWLFQIQISGTDRCPTCLLSFHSFHSAWASLEKWARMLVLAAEPCSIQNPGRGAVAGRENASNATNLRNQAREATRQHGAV